MNKDQVIVEELYESLRGIWHKPGPIAAAAFVLTELGEVVDELIRMNLYGKFTRNVTRTATRITLRAELGDLYMMTCALANCFDVDLSESLLGRAKKLAKKHANEDILTTDYSGYVKSARYEAVMAKLRIAEDFIHEIASQDWPDEFDPEGFRRWARNTIKNMEALNENSRP